VPAIAEVRKASSKLGFSASTAFCFLRRSLEIPGVQRVHGKIAALQMLCGVMASARFCSSSALLMSRE